MAFPPSSPPSSRIPAELAEAVSAVCPGFAAAGVLHRSATSLLLAGEVWGEPVVAKLLTSRVPFWRETFAREIDTYRYFEQHRPPFSLPKLILADERHPLLVVSRLDGRPLVGGRYPETEVPPRRLAALFTALGRVNGWRAPVGVLPATLDYRSRIERYRRDGQLSADEADTVTSLVHSVGDAREFCHGDVVPPHVLRAPGAVEEGDYAFVDWAFAGTFLPGFDLAKTWVVLRATFGVRSEIQDRLRGDGEIRWHGFLVNLAIVLAQELRNQAGTGGERQAALQADWLLLREWLAAA